MFKKNKVSKYIGSALILSPNEIKIMNDEKIFKDPQFAYHLGYEKTINTRNLFTIKIGKSFRYPNVDERIGFGSVSSAHNFGLNSQNSYDFDISHKFFDDRISFQSTIYYMRLRNEIAYDNSTFLNRNLATWCFGNLTATVFFFLVSTFEIFDFFFDLR